jgi:uncharacterized membrane protein
VPGAVASQARAISSRGDIVGQFGDGSGATHGFLLRKGAYTTFDVPGATVTRPRGIDERGDIVGNYDVAGLPHGFLAR